MRVSSLLFLATSLVATYGLTYHSADISSLLVEESEGKTYKDSSGKTAPLETMYLITSLRRLWLICCVYQSCWEWNEFG